VLLNKEANRTLFSSITRIASTRNVDDTRNDTQLTAITSGRFNFLIFTIFNERSNLTF